VSGPSGIESVLQTVGADFQSSPPPHCFWSSLKCCWPQK